MTWCAKAWLTIGASLAGLAVIAGAWAAHGLDRYCAAHYADVPAQEVAGLTVPTSWKYLQDFKTGARYQMYHALAILVVGLLLRFQSSRALQIAGVCFLVGTLGFSGSLYLLVLTGQTAWGAVTPFGGLLLIAGWLALAIGCQPCGGKDRSESE